MNRLARVCVGLLLLGVLSCAGCSSAVDESEETPTPPVQDEVAEEEPPPPPPAPAPWRDDAPMDAKKPVVYLYPPAKTAVTVNLVVDGTITQTDPPLDSEGTWRVVADPSGRLVDLDSGRVYPYLFWEADMSLVVDRTTGFVVPGAGTRSFLAEKLAMLGLSGSESREFMEYWVPLMETNAYNFIRFEGPEYEREARLVITPRPDSVIRVFMAYEPLDAPVIVTPQILKPPAPREGFVAVEWGGGQLPRR